MSCKYHTNIPCAVFSAGWLVSQLHGPILERQLNPKSPLPTVNELSRSDRVLLALTELGTLLSGALSGVLELESEASTRILALIETVKGAWKPEAPNEVVGLRSAVENLHVGLLETLTIADHQWGTAYVVGRSISNTCWLPRTHDDFDNQFNRYRLANIQGWLADLALVFPQFSASAVSISLDHWATWLEVNHNLDWEKHGTVVEQALRMQGEKWRALLSGDRDPTSLLTPDGYVAAGEAALRRASIIFRRIAVHFCVPLAIVLAATIAGVFFAIHYSAGTAKFWTSFASLTAGLGITGRGFQTTTKRLTATAGKSLITASEKDVIASAATSLPTIRQSRLQRHSLLRHGVPLVSPPVPERRQRVAANQKQADNVDELRLEAKRDPT